MRKQKVKPPAETREGYLGCDTAEPSGWLNSNPFYDVAAHMTGRFRELLAALSTAESGRKAAIALNATDGEVKLSRLEMATPASEILWKDRRDGKRWADNVIEQENGAGFLIDETGSMLLSVPVEEASGHLKPLIEEHVAGAIAKGLSFADAMLVKFDRTQRLTRAVVAADISASGVFGWRTNREQAANPDSMQVSMGNNASGPVMLNPPDRTRMALRAERVRIAEDLLALLRRQHRA